MNRFATTFPYSFVLFFCAILAIAGCGSGGSKLRVLQGSPFQPSVSVLINGNTVSSALAYGADSGYLAVSSSTPHLQIQLPNAATPILDQMPTLSGANSTFVTFTGPSGFTGFLVPDNNAAPSSGNANLRVLSGSPNLASADVYILQPPASISGVSPTVSGVAFQSATNYQSLVAGTYDVVLTLPGSKIIVVDSGTISLSAGQVRTVATIATAAGGSMGVVLADLN